jgi:hypothetical protein
MVDGKYSHEKIFDDLHVLMMPRGTALWSQKIVTTKNKKCSATSKMAEVIIFGNSS